jgi:hypothetical protein
VMAGGCKSEVLLARLALRRRRELDNIVVCDVGEGDDRSGRANHASERPHRKGKLLKCT